jgi:predicted transcriptional regulator of viral defense system
MSRTSNSANDPSAKAIEIFRRHGGVLRTRDAIGAGIHPVTLYALRDRGNIETLSRGLYRLTDSPPLGEPDLLVVAHRIPQGVICLLSALSYHQLTNQIPHVIDVALPPGTEEPRLDYPPIRTYRFSGASFTEGIEHMTVDGTSVRVYDPEKTIADCFKFRNRIGMDTITEALRMYRDRKKVKVNMLMHYADVCRVKRIMQPYLEALLG